MKYSKRMEKLEERRRAYEKMIREGHDDNGYRGFKRPGSNKK